MTDIALLKRLRKLEREVAYLKAVERVVPETMFTASILALPGLRGFWPMSSLWWVAGSRVRDLSVQGNNLTAQNTPTFGVIAEKIPYVRMVQASSQYLNRVDGGAGNWADITGTEGYIDNTLTSSRGLTIGGWFYFSSNTGSADGMMSKWVGNTNNRSYMIRVDWSTPAINFYVNSTGAGAGTVSMNSSVAPTVSKWHFVVGIFRPSNTMSFYVNGTRDDLAVGVPASIFDSTASFEIGRYTTGAGAFGYYDGLASMCFLCASAITDTNAKMLFELSRDIYGV